MCDHLEKVNLGLNRILQHDSDPPGDLTITSYSVENVIWN